MEFLAGRFPDQPDFLLRTLTLYPHPSTSLWRAIEAREIWKEFVNRGVETSVLDLGCGDGRFSRAVFDRRSIDVGLDISSSAVSLAKQTSNHGLLVVGDGTRLPFRDGVFGTIFSNSVLEHVPDVPKVLAEARRVLRRGGVLIFTVPSPNFTEFLFLPSLLHKIPFLKFLGDWYSRNRNALLSHHNICEFKLWRSMLESVGFQGVRGRSCLSKAALQAWDMTAIMIYVLRTPLIRSPNALSLIVSRSQRLRVFLLRRILGIFYVSANSEGADLIITAEASLPIIQPLSHEEKADSS